MFLQLSQDQFTRSACCGFLCVFDAIFMLGFRYADGQAGKRGEGEDEGEGGGGGQASQQHVGGGPPRIF